MSKLFTESECCAIVQAASGRPACSPPAPTNPGHSLAVSPEIVQVDCTSLPYTVRAAISPLPAGASRQAFKPVFVQVQISQSSNCALLRDGWVAGDGSFLWSLDLLMPYKGRGSFPEHRVRTCSGFDGRCTCAGESPFSEQAKPAAETEDRASVAPHVSEGFDPKEVTCL